MGAQVHDVLACIIFYMYVHMHVYILYNTKFQGTKLSRLIIKLQIFTRNFSEITKLHGKISLAPCYHESSPRMYL